jgi:hypothetical protein
MNKPENWVVFAGLIGKITISLDFIFWFKSENKT